jgi:hypothetical protein
MPRGSRRRYAPGARDVGALAIIALTVLACAPGAQPTTGVQDGTSPTPRSPSASPTSPSSAPATTPEIADGTAPPTTPPVATAWSRLDVEGPPAREDHTWTVDEAGTAAYLFGGRADGDPRADLWRYDLATDDWQRLSPDGPRPKARFGHSAVWVPGVGLVVWAGQAGSAFFDDLWAYDPAAGRWQELPSKGETPAPRYGSCAAIGPDGRLWISHGFTDRGRFFDTRAYDFVTGRWSDETPEGPTPVERCLHDCLWTPDGQLLLYAGQTTGVPALADLWTFDPEAGTWTEQTGDPRPRARQLYALATSGGDGWIFGGAGKGGDKLADLWAIDLTTLAWRPVDAGDGPSARSGASLIADDDRGRLLLFGGTTGRADRGDTWQLEIGSQP